MNFLNVDTSPELQGFLDGLLNESKIPNLYDYLGNDYDESTMPERYRTFKYNYPSFLDITGHILTIWLAAFTVFGLGMATFLIPNSTIQKVGKLVKE